MARFNTSGLDGIIRDVARLGQAGEEIGESMLLAGAEEVKKSWKQAAMRHGYWKTGDMINSVGYRRKPKNVGGVKIVDIYPQGTDRKGVRNAEKAFILHYGSSSINGTSWVDEADEDAGPKVQDAMEGIFNRYVNRIL